MMTTDFDNKMLQKALQLAARNVRNGGGPFGAMIVNNAREVVSRGVNRVVPKSDPTAHAEITAIRTACRRLKTFNLSGHTLYTSCEPCPMCLAAIYWAHIDKVFYAGTKHSAAAAGFDDELIYREIDKSPHSRKIPFIRIPIANSDEPFLLWDKQDNKTPY